MMVFRRVAAGITHTLLLLAFFLGIGPVSIIAKFLGTPFLHKQKTKPSWRLPTGSNNPERMY